MFDCVEKESLLKENTYIWLKKKSRSWLENINVLIDYDKENDGFS